MKLKTIINLLYKMASDCGFPTIKGTPCKKRVSLGSRCDRHQELDSLYIRNLNRDSCEQYHAQYGRSIREDIGKGVWSTVRSVCIKTKACKESCEDYVIKSIDTSLLQENVKTHLRREIEAQECVNKLGIGPKIKDWWKCKGIVYLLMERVGINYETLFESQGKNFTDLDIESMMAAADSLDRFKIVHGDLKPDNMTLCMGEKASTCKPAVLIDFSFTVDYDTDPVKSFTSVPFMGWTRLSYPVKWVPAINRNMLACYLVTKCGVDPNRLKGSTTSLEAFKKTLGVKFLFRDSFDLDNFYRKNDKKLKEELVIIEEEKE